MREHPADAPPEAEPTGAYPSPPATVEATVVTVDNPDENRDMPLSGDKPEA